ncbi:hypothetical protein TWF694_002705 [Orbilia ellipsospora]|uniref:Peptidase S33 tripeptidyl aminopeptidase-like C-terminal domain-containing protein n=1 Tax=Orbilia ellipsospora TaxID=2528407 RepID=A0AAV9X2W2_9PEZI
MLFFFAGLCCLLSGTQAFVLPTRLESREAKVPKRERLFKGISEDVDLKWHDCVGDSEHKAYRCARLSVPLDYKKPENGLRAIIPIIKFPASKDASYKGAVLINPGGPGGLGTETTYDLKFATATQANITGPGWDIIGFDPRGIGYSVPFFTCNATSFEPDRQNATVLPSSKDHHSFRRRFFNATSMGMIIPDSSPKLNSPEEDLYFHNNCTKYSGAYNQAGQHMNSVVVATDMLSIAKALAREAGRPEANVTVNFYGMSYGTALGQIFASLYPSNVGKFLLDGVLDVNTYIPRKRMYDTVAHADEAWSGFFTFCNDFGSDHCKFFAKGGVNAIRGRFNKIMSKLDPTKYEGKNSSDIEKVTTLLGDVKNKMLLSAYNPNQAWVGMSEFLVIVESVITPDEISQWNQTAISEWAEARHKKYLEKHAAPPLAYSDEAQTSVECTDGRNQSGIVITPAEHRERYNISNLAAHTTIGSPETCSKWPISPSWKWYGPIGGKTATPILFTGNRLDPVTPYESAENASKLFSGAKWYYADEIGHVTLDRGNECAYKHARAYFQNGTLPESGTMCKRGKFTIAE